MNPLWNANYIYCDLDGRKDAKSIKCQLFLAKSLWSSFLTKYWKQFSLQFFIPKHSCVNTKVWQVQEKNILFWASELFCAIFVCRNGIQCAHIAWFGTLLVKTYPPLNENHGMFHVHLISVELTRYLFENQIWWRILECKVKYTCYFVKLPSVCTCQGCRHASSTSHLRSGHMYRQIIMSV